MKLGFAKQDRPKEDITRDRDPNAKTLLTGLAAAAALLGGIAYASLKVADALRPEDEDRDEEE